MRKNELTGLICIRAGRPSTPTGKEFSGGEGFPKRGGTPESDNEKCPVEEEDLKGGGSVGFLSIGSQSKRGGGVIKRHGVFHEARGSSWVPSA